MEEVPSETIIDVQIRQAKPVTNVTNGTRQHVDMTSWEGRVSSAEKRSSVKRGIQAAQSLPKSRAALVESLRVQVEAGTYKIDSMELAAKILAHETHFLQDGQK